DDIRVKHPWNHVPPSWETLGHPPAGTTIDLHVALKPHDENALIDALYEVNTPRSPKHVLSNNPLRTMYSPVSLFRCRYRTHLSSSKEEVAQLAAPHPDTLELAHSWLAHHGVQSSSISTTHGGGWLTITEVPVSWANELLGASYQLYRRTETNDTTILRTIGYALPVALHTHVKTVVPTTYFASTGTLWQTPQKRSRRRNCGYGAEARSHAGGPALAYMPAADAPDMIGIVGFGGDYLSMADLTTFMLKRRTDADDATLRSSGSTAVDTTRTTPTRSRTKTSSMHSTMLCSPSCSTSAASMTACTCRGIPDISAQAFKTLYCKCEKSFMGGTSCVALTVAGIISLLNDFLISNDKEPLGWLDRWLYWLYDDGLHGLYDVTSGSYPGWGTDGFSAIAGWDPVRPADFVSLHF
ncbi:Pro-kumamolisin, activation domain-containing protein, partial [Lactarius akahatsu]